MKAVKGGKKKKATHPVIGSTSRDVIFQQGAAPAAERQLTLLLGRGGGWMWLADYLGGIIPGRLGAHGDLWFVVVLWCCGLWVVPLPKWPNFIDLQMGGDPKNHLQMDDPLR